MAASVKSYFLFFPTSSWTNVQIRPTFKKSYTTDKKLKTSDHTANDSNTDKQIICKQLSEFFLIFLLFNVDLVLEKLIVPKIVYW